VAIVGVGGTGAHIAQQVTYLGIRDFVIVEDDAADETSMNRLVTATAADLDTPKGILARRLIKSAAPSAQVTLVAGKLQTPAAIDALKRVDIIFGCVDNDGARLILNEISRAFNVPYFDVAVGIEVGDTGVELAGGRLAVITPGGPCLHCAGELDKQEAQFFLSTRKEQAFQIARGYVRGMDVPAPSVVSLNAAVASLAVNEFATFFSGLRPVSFFTDLDLLGSGRPIKSQWLTPRRVTADPGCVVCPLAGLGDRADVDRYGRRMPEVVDVVGKQR
jgi:molybdopterin/thiamine biosynthesis adenylyltransferase